MPLPAIELCPFIVESTAQGVYERLTQMIRHRQRHCRTVIVHNIEPGATHAFTVDPAEYRTNVRRLDQ